MVIEAPEAVEANELTMAVEALLVVVVEFA